MRTDTDATKTIRKIAAEKFNLPDAAQLSVHELAELNITAINYSGGMLQSIRFTRDTLSFQYGFVCGARWQKRNPGARLQPSTGKDPEK